MHTCQLLNLKSSRQLHNLQNDQEAPHGQDGFHHTRACGFNTILKVCIAERSLPPWSGTMSNEASMSTLRNISCQGLKKCLHIWQCTTTMANHTWSSLLRTNGLPMLPNKAWHQSEGDEHPCGLMRAETGVVVRLALHKPRRQTVRRDEPNFTQAVARLTTSHLQLPLTGVIEPATHNASL